jgi:uncharacterized protein (DUF1499 family)
MKRLPKIVCSVIAVLSIGLLVRCSVLGRSSQEGEALGRQEGLLAHCPDKPNCVCSEFEEDAEHYLAPLRYVGRSPRQAWSDLVAVIEELGGEVVTSDGNYLAATFSSALFGFVDDVECRLDPLTETIHIRSASRVGHSDMGVNQKRVAEMTRLFDRRADRAD